MSNFPEELFQRVKPFFCLTTAAKGVAVSASLSGVFVSGGENGGAGGPTLIGPSNM